MIDPEEIELFERDGAICLRQRFNSDWLDCLSRGFERNLAEPGPYATTYTPPGNPGGYRDDLMNWARIPEYSHFIHESPAAAIAGELTRSRYCRILLENMLIKESGTLEGSPWHQDLPYYCVDGNKLCSVWVPLDVIPKPACVEFVAGSHRWRRRYTPIKFADETAYEYPDGTFDAPPDMQTILDNHDVLSWALEPGDCLVFHMLSLHRAPSTRGLLHRRRAFSTRWVGDDAVYVERPGPVFPDFPPPRLAVGEPFDHPSFPIVWRRDAET